MRIVGERGATGTLVTLIVSVLFVAPVSAAEARDARGTRASRSRADVEALIKRVGPTTPEWWTEVRLTYPSTLDLSWPEPPPTKEWDASRNVGQYIWSVINENPSRWREGVKLLHHLLLVHKDDRVKLRRVMVALGRMYSDLLEDFPRAAFWWRKAIAVKGGDRHLELSLADCYWKLGSREMAVEAISGFSTDFTRNGNLIKLWSDMGDTERALRLADAKARIGLPDVGWLCAGDACRLAGRYDDALRYYAKVVECASGSRDLDRNKSRARASLEAIRLFEALDIGKVPDGKYRASSLGYEAPVEVEVTVRGGAIRDVAVTQHREKQFYSALTDTPRRIIEKQSVREIDATTGATITSEAIINATAKALSGAMK